MPYRTSETLDRMFRGQSSKHRGNDSCPWRRISAWRHAGITERMLAVAGFTHDVRRTTHDLLSYQSNGDITNSLQRRRAHLVDSVVRRVMIREIEVDHIDGPDPRLLQGHVVVGEEIGRAHV